MLLLEFFDQLEEETDRLRVAFDSQTHVITVVLDDLHVDEIVAEALDDTE